MAVVTQTIQDQVSQLYIAYFGRAPEAVGFAHWANSLASGMPVTTAALKMADSFEFRGAYNGLTPDQQVTKLYENVLDRAPDAAGKAYWVNLLNTGTSIGAVAWGIVNSAFQQGTATDDGNLVLNKVAVAEYFAVTLGSNDLDIAATAFDGVTKDVATVQAAEDRLYAEVNPTPTYTLTTGIDTINAGGNNNVFQASTSAATAALNTFQAFDTIAATGTGNTLNITANDYANGDNLAAATVSRVQTVNVRALDATAADVLNVNASNFVGATAVNSDRSSSAVTITNLATGATAGMIGNGSTTNGAFTFGYKTSSAAAALNISGGTTAGNVAISTAPTAVTINSTGAANTIGTLNVGASATTLTINADVGLTTGALTGAALKTITVTGDAATAATPATPAANDITSAVQLGALPAAVTTIDASAMTQGGVAATLVSTVTSFKGGAGTDTVTTAALTSTTASIINAGEGTDVLRVGAVTDINTATTAKQYAGFEVLDALATTAAIDTSLFTNSAIGALRVGGNNTFTNLSATQAANVTVYANASANYGVKNATDPGTIDTVSMTVSDGLTASNTITLANITAAGVENIDINAVDKVTVSSLTGASAMTSLDITGAGNTSITTGALGVILNSTINASALTGTFTLNASAATGNGLGVTGSATKANTVTLTSLVDSFTGGSDKDTVIALKGNDIISLGAGNDTVTGNLGADRITLGDGSDIVVLLPGDTYVYATGGTDMISTVTIAGTIVGQNGSVTTTVNGVSVTGTVAGASSPATATEIAAALVSAINSNTQLAEYVVASNSSGVVSIASLNDTPVSVGTTTVGTITGATATLSVAATSSTASSGALSVDTVTDFNFGGTGSTEAVDQINLKGVATTALTVVAGGELSGANLSAAINSAFAVGGVLNGTTNTVGIFTYGSDQYLIGNVGASGSAFGTATAITNATTLENASDFAIKITGYSGTLDSSDFIYG